MLELTIYQTDDFRTYVVVKENGLKTTGRFAIGSVRKLMVGKRDHRLVGIVRRTNVSHLRKNKIDRVSVNSFKMTTRLKNKLKKQKTNIQKRIPKISRAHKDGQIN